jgi:hypothetical protein
MGLYEAIDSLPEGARLKYKSSDGMIVIYEPYIRGPNRIDVTVRTQSANASGKPHETRHDYEDIDREWCVRQEEVLRDFGIDPNNFTII